MLGNVEAVEFMRAGEDDEPPPATGEPSVVLAGEGECMMVLSNPLEEL